MKKIVQISLVYMVLLATMPVAANSVDAQQVNRNLREESGSLMAQYRGRQDRRYAVYYRRPRQQTWLLEGFHVSRRDAEVAARRLDRRGFRTYIQLSRRIMNRR